MPESSSPKVYSSENTKDSYLWSNETKDYICDQVEPVPGD